jgi:hypothetical protein
MSAIDILSSRAEALLGLLDVDGLTLLPKSFRQTGVDQYAISGFANGSAISELQAKGLTVNVVTSQADLEAHDAQVMQEIANNNPGSRGSS